jgi:hypothetical protein
MENEEKKKQREPFPAEHTPQPPQDIDPSITPRGSADPTSEGERDKRTNEKIKPEEKKEKPKLLGESEIEIDDETTI